MQNERWFNRRPVRLNYACLVVLFLVFFSGHARLVERVWRSQDGPNSRSDNEIQFRRGLQSRCLLRGARVTVYPVGGGAFSFCWFTQLHADVNMNGGTAFGSLLNTLIRLTLLY